MNFQRHFEYFYQIKKYEANRQSADRHGINL